MSGPRKVIDLDATPEAKWRIEEGAAHLYKHRVWLKEQGGCVVCAQEMRQDPKGQTLKAEDSGEYMCLTHGPLMRVPFKVKRTYYVYLGPFTREGKEEYDDDVLVPADLDEEKKNELLNKLLDTQVKEEKETPVVQE